MRALRSMAIAVMDLYRAWRYDRAEVPKPPDARTQHLTMIPCNALNTCARVPTIQEIRDHDP